LKHLPSTNEGEIPEGRSDLVAALAGLKMNLFIEVSKCGLLELVG